MGPSHPRNSTRAHKARPSSGSRRKPSPSKPAKPLSVAEAAADILMSERECLRPAAGALREIRHNIDIASAVAYVCAAALRAQTADNETDVALLLQRCCGDALFDQMQRINRLLGEPTDEDGGAP